MEIRKLDRDDREKVRALLVETDVFKPAEIEVALELIDTFLDHPKQKDYEMYSCVETNEVLGYVCLGPTPFTGGTFDLYWLAVKPSAQRHGVGRKMLEFGEEIVGRKGGSLLITETSSQPKYLKTRTFYLHNGYTEVAQIRDYYDVGDDLVIYGKYLRQKNSEGG